MSIYEILSLLISFFSSLAIAVSALYVGLQFKRAAIIHKENLEWNKKIETRKKLDDYNRLDSAFFLEEKIHFSNEKQPLKIDKIHEKIKENHRFEIHLGRLLNYFEALAIGIESGIYDEKMVRVTRRKVMLQTFIAFQEYIEYLRNEINSLVYIKYENLVQKWSDEEKKNQTLYEFKSSI